MKVLIIEDDPSNKIGLMHTVFAVQPKAEIEVASNREEAIAKLGNFHHLVIVSYRLLGDFPIPPEQPTIWLGDSNCPIPCLPKGDWNGIRESIRVLTPTQSKSQTRPTYNVMRKPDGVVVVQQPKKWMKLAVSVGTVVVTSLASIAGYIYFKGQDDANQAHQSKALTDKINNYDQQIAPLKSRLDTFESTSALKYLQYDSRMTVFEKSLDEFKKDFKSSVDALFTRLDNMDAKFDRKLDDIRRNR